MERSLDNNASDWQVVQRSQKGLPRKVSPQNRSDTTARHGCTALPVKRPQKPVAAKERLRKSPRQSQKPVAAKKRLRKARRQPQKSDAAKERLRKARRK